MGAANVEPAPLMELDDEPPPPPLLELSLEPQADTPSASTRAAAGASQIRDLTGSLLGRLTARGDTRIGCPAVCYRDVAAL